MMTGIVQGTDIYLSVLLLAILSLLAFVFANNRLKKGMDL